MKSAKNQIGSKPKTDGNKKAIRFLIFWRDIFGHKGTQSDPFVFYAPQLPFTFQRTMPTAAKAMVDRPTFAKVSARRTRRL
jgi:hypothetical protein